MTIDEFLKLFQRVHSNSDGSWMVTCPGHDDGTASLHVTAKPDRLLLKCHAGCQNEHIVGKLDLRMSDLFLSGSNGDGHRVAAAHLTLEDLAAAKGLPVKFLTDCGVMQEARGLRITYRLRNGELAPRQRTRWTVAAKDGSAWSGPKAGALVPYGLWRLDDAMEKGELFLVEGETDALAAWFHNVPCVGIPGADLTKLLTADVLHGIDTLWIVKEPDRGGDTFVNGLTERLKDLGWTGRASVVTMPPPSKDLADLHRNAGSRFSEEMEAARRRALRISPPLVSVVDAVDDVRPADAALLPYHFTPAFPPEHGMIAYAAARTDAAHEFHEVVALILLAAATPRVRVKLAPYPNGLATNVYALLVGDSTRSRKSTVKDIGRDLQQRVLPDSLLADLSSPEAFIEQLARRPDDSSTWYVDEFADMLEKLHHQKHMTGLTGALLTVYGGETYQYRRHSKRTKAGVTVEDQDVIVHPHLSILGATTPAVFGILKERDILSGLLPRFAIVMPAAKPPRRPFYEVAAGTEAEREALVQWLHRLYAWASTGSPRSVQFVNGALQALDAFGAAIEESAEKLDDAVKAMVSRLNTMAVKVAMLSAAGRPGTVDGETLQVALADAEAGVLVGARWRGYAVAFAERLGESAFERILQRCSRLVQKTKGPLGRRVVAQNAHVEKKLLDAVEATLLDRGLIKVDNVGASSGRGGRDTTLWEWVR